MVHFPSAIVLSITDSPNKAFFQDQFADMDRSWDKLQHANERVPY